MACLLKNEPASYALWQVKQWELRSHSESESEEGDQYVGGRRPETT